MKKVVLSRAIGGWSWLAVGILSGVLAGCGGGSASTGGGAPVETPLAAWALRPVTDAQLTQRLRTALGVTARTDAVALPVAGAPGSAEASAAPATSTTLLQEAAVDESDLIKSDGSQVYSVVPASAGAAERLLRQPLQAAASDAALGSGQSVASPLGSSARVQGLYLDPASASLWVVGESGGTDGPVYRQWFRPLSWVGGRTEVALLDAGPTLATRHTVSVGAQLVGSRRLGNRLFLVLRSYAQPAGFDPYWGVPARTANETKVSSLQAADVLPTLRVNGGPDQPLLAPDSCLAPAGTDQPTADIITVVGLDLSGTQPRWGARCFSGSTEAFYLSANNVYLANTRTVYTPSDAQGVPRYPGDMTTDIHRFALDGLTPSYQGSGQVLGHLGFDQARKAFRLSEHNGLLRVATQQAQAWGPVMALPAVGTPGVAATVVAGAASDQAATPTSPVRVTVLRPTAGPALEVVSTLPNARRPDPLGKPGEQLYASRFLGDRAYLVTYRLTDPLYVLDLSDPTDPKVTGELAVPGYSDYLFALSDRFLLGVGKDAQTDGTVGDGRFAWYQGVKVSVIDVADPARPLEVAREIVGQRGTDATVLHDPHGMAVLSLPATGAPAIARVALPVRLHDTTQPGASGQPSDYFGFTRTQLSRLEVNLSTGALTRATDLLASDNATQRDIQNDRVLLTDRQAHHYRNGEWASWRWD